MMGDERSAGYKLGYLTASAVVLAVKLPLLPLIGLYKGIVSIKNALTEIKINKYYEMVPKMDLYYKSVTTILSHLTVNMGLSINGPDAQDPVDEFPGDDLTFTPGEVAHIQSQAPEILKSGPDILFILSKRERWERPDRSNISTYLFLDAIQTVGSYAADTFTKFTHQVFKRYQYVARPRLRPLLLMPIHTLIVSFFMKR